MLPIVGYHVVFGAYGFWLPNDPRGSWSDFVSSQQLYEAGGPSTKTDCPNSLAHRPHDRAKRLKTKEALLRPALRFNLTQIKVVGRGIGDYLKTTEWPVWACAVMRDHVHLVIGIPHLMIERLVIQLKGAATRELIARRCHPYANSPDKHGQLPKCFVRGQWKKFLHTHDMRRTINYVEENPLNAGLAKQIWSFVQPYYPSRANHVRA